MSSVNIITGCFHGSYGQNCLKICSCPNTCDCDPETGECPSVDNRTMLNATQTCKSAQFNKTMKCIENDIILSVTQATRKNTLMKYIIIFFSLKLKILILPTERIHSVLWELNDKGCGSHVGVPNKIS